jgi:hypothetical protein
VDDDETVSESAARVGYLAVSCSVDNKRVGGRAIDRFTGVVRGCAERGTMTAACDVDGDDGVGMPDLLPAICDLVLHNSVQIE